MRLVGLMNLLSQCARVLFDSADTAGKQSDYSLQADLLNAMQPPPQPDGPLHLQEILDFREAQLLGGSGGAKRDRTADLLNAIQALSQLSYSPIRTSAAWGRHRVYTNDPP